MNVRRYLAAILLLVSTGANATLIDFESGLDPFFSYSGITNGSTTNTGGSGYNNLLAFTASNGLVFNPNEVTPSTFSTSSAGLFDLTSFVIAGGWGNQTLTIEGLAANAVLFSAALDVTTAAQVFVANWSNIDALRITTDPNGYVDTTDLGGSGQHWALDNMVIFENSSDVPVPATFALFGLGLAGLGWVRRKQA